MCPAQRTRPAVAVLPGAPESILQAVEAGGGRIADPARADAIVWTDPAGASGLREILGASVARWVQLPFAGIESFVEAGVIDASHTWTCAKGIYGHATAEQALALVLAAARFIHGHVAIRRWWRRSDGGTHRRLAGTTALIVGTGGIGGSLAAMLRPLGPRILAVNRSGKPLEGALRTAPVDELPGLLPEADWVILAAALTPQTRGLFDGAMLARMRSDAWIINVARGPMIVTPALVEALEGPRIGGAALDVTDPEPLPDDHPLWRVPNCIITSHTANTFEMALPELSLLVRRNVERFASGEPLEGLVDPALGY